MLYSMKRFNQRHQNSQPAGGDHIKKLSFPGTSTIRSKMMWMFLIVILPLFAAGIILLVSISGIITKTALESASSAAVSLRMSISDLTFSVESVAEALCAEEDIIDFLNNDYSAPSQYYSFYSENKIVSEYLSMIPHIEQIRIYTSRSDFVCNAVFRYADADIVSQEWYVDAVKENGSGKWTVFASEEDKSVHLAYIRPISSESGEAVGVCVCVASNDRIAGFMTDKSYQTVLSVQDAIVYYSSAPNISAGLPIENQNDLDILLPSANMTLDKPLTGKSGYTVMNNFVNESTGDNFQVYLIIPDSVISDDINRLSVIYSGYCGLLLILSLLIIILFTSVFSRRIRLLSDKMHSVAGGNFDIDYTISGNDEIAGLFADLEQMVKSMQSLMDEVYRAEIENEAFKYNQMEAEFKALASQINPHFLYNTLETIRMKAYCSNDKETADLVKKLGKFMRRCLEFKDGEVTLRSELEFTNGYLELQAARFGNRVSYSIYSEVEKDYMILPLIIQPLVENAFVHGIEGSKGNGRIDISVYYRGDFVMIDVADNGQGISDDKMNELIEKLRKNDTSSGKSIGLTNVNKRIKMYHGDQYGLTVSSKVGEGTTISVKLPREPLGKSKPELLLEKYNTEKSATPETDKETV